MPHEGDQKELDGISTSGEFALVVEDGDALAGAERLPYGAPGGDLAQRGARGVEARTTITATATPPQQVVGRKVAIAGHLMSGGGADLVAVPVVLYRTDHPTNKARIATTTTDSTGHYQFTLTDNVPTKHAYTVYARGRSTYSRVQSNEVQVTYHPRLLRDVRRAGLAPAARIRTLTVFNLAWYELLAIFLILAGEALLLAGHEAAGVGIQALNIVMVSAIVVALHGERTELVQALALISLFRVVNLSFALIPTTTLYWLAVIYGLMFIPIIGVVAYRKLSRRDLGLIGGLQLTYLIPFGILVGAELALIEYQILANPALIPAYSLVWLVELSLVMIFVVTLVEELLFRALLQPELVARSGPVVGILITSIIFAVMSLGFANYFELFFAFGVGIIFGVAYYKTKNLPFVVTMHAVNNILLFGVLPFFPILVVPH